MLHLGYNTRWKAFSTLVLATLLVSGAYVAGSQVAGSFRIEISHLSTDGRPADQRLPWNPPGEQLILLYVGNSKCRPSNDPQLPALVNDLKLQARAYAEEIGASLTAIGAASDESVATGLAHLDKLRPFDELFVGGGWTSSGLLNFVWRHGFPGGTPAIVVLSRSIIAADDTAAVSAYAVRNERVLYYATGLSAIRHLHTSNLAAVLRRRAAHAIHTLQEPRRIT